MGYIGKNSLMCIHGDEQSKCPFCYDEWKATGKSPEPVGTYGEFLNKKAKREAKKDLQPVKINRATNRVLDKVIDALKDAEWPDGVEPSNWRMVAINAIEKQFGRI